MKRLVLVCAVVASAALAVGCSKDSAQGTGSTQAAAKKIDMAAAKAEFTTRCSSCHGNGGHGDGPAAAALNPKPRNYTDKAWQASVTDEQIKKTILMGGAAVGKSPIMPAAPDLESKPDVVDGLVAVVRSFGK